VIFAEKHWSERCAPKEQGRDLVFINQKRSSNLDFRTLRAEN